MHKAKSGSRKFILILVAGYVVGLVVYLQLRLLFGDDLWWLAFLNMFAQFLFLPLIVTLIVTLLLRSWFLAILQIILILVASIWFGPRFLPKSGTDIQGDPLNVITMNVFPGNQTIDRTVAWLLAQPADIILLQDIGREGNYPALKQLSQEFPYMVEELKGEGQIIFSRFPVQSSESISLVEENHPDALRVTLDFNGKPIVVYSVHLENPLEFSRSRLPNGGRGFDISYNDSRRNDQIASLLQYLDNETLPHIVAGDFNMGSYSTVHDVISLDLKDAFVEAGSGFGATWSVPTGYGRINSIPLILRLDYIWYSPEFGAQELITGEAIGSDHLPVWASLRLEQ